jgi:hypothetical protein
VEDLEIMRSIGGHTSGFSSWRQRNNYLESQRQPHEEGTFTAMVITAM